MKRIVLLLLMAPLMAMAQHTISGFAKLTNRDNGVMAKPTLMKGHEVYLIPSDKVDFKPVFDYVNFTSKYCEGKYKPARFTYVIKKEYKKQRKDLEEKMDKMSHDSRSALGVATLTQSIQSVVVDNDGNYKFEKVPDGKYYLVIKTDEHTMYDFVTAKVDGGDLQKNITDFGY